MCLPRSRRCTRSPRRYLRPRCSRARRSKAPARSASMPTTARSSRESSRACWRWPSRRARAMWKNTWCPASIPDRSGGYSQSLVSMSRLRTYLSFVRFSHSVFALPFDLAGALLAARHVAITWPTVGWILVAMVAARSAAMGFNRLVDARMDALNPRTANRELPRGAMSTVEAVAFVIAASAVFVFASWRLNPLCLLLSPVALAIVFWYTIAKRVTAYTQMFLGLAIGTWVGGFDVLYACQDVEFDRAHGLRSIPVRFGVPASLTISRVMHVVTIGALLALPFVTPLPRLYDIGVIAVVAPILGWEQSLVRANDLSQVKRAFDVNGYVGILYFVVLAVSVYVG